MSVGQIQKQIAKTRQSEVKVHLATLYTIEKAFHEEFVTYCTDLQVIGFSVAGKVRYAIGFANDHAPYAVAVAAGYTPAVGGGSGVFAVTDATCGAAPLQDCDVIGSNGDMPQVIAGTAAGGDTYVASANAPIYEFGRYDTWTINEAKALLNSNPGIP